MTNTLDSTIRTAGVLLARLTIAGAGLLGAPASGSADPYRSVDAANYVCRARPDGPSDD